MKTNFLIFSIFFLVVSCNSSIIDLHDKNSNEILSLLIDEFGKPTVPSRELYNLKPFSKIQKDSILNQNEKITLFPIQKEIHQKFSKKEKLGEEFNKLVDNLSNLKETRKIDLSKIEISRPYQLSIIDTLAIKNDRRYIEKNFDKLINFSQISFNEHYTKAVLTVGVNMGPMNGYSSLVFLEKINDVWQIKNVDTYSIS